MGALERSAAMAQRERLLLGARAGYSADMPIAGDKLGALRDVSVALAHAHIPHALIGGLAVGVHSGVPRATEDVDLAVPSTVRRARIVEVLRVAGFQLTGEFPHSVNFRHASGEPVQLASDAEFDPMIAAAAPISVGAFTIPVVGLEHLIAMKQRSAADPNRRRSKALRDRADVELLLGDKSDPDEGW